SKTFTDNAGIFGKVYFPRIILPLSKVVSGMIKFLIQFSLFLLIWGCFFAKGFLQPNLYILLTPLLLIIMSIMSLGFCLFFSSMTTKYRYLTFLLAFGLQLLMYDTPFIYPLSSLARYPKIFLFVKFNPLTWIFESLKYGYFGKGAVFSLNGLLYSLCFSI